MALWGRILLVLLLPLVATVPVDAYARCTFQPMTCCEPEAEEDLADSCGSCCEEEAADEEPEESEAPAPTDCCCVTTVVASTSTPTSTRTAEPVRALLIPTRRLVGRTTAPETPPPAV